MSGVSILLKIINSAVILCGEYQFPAYIVIKTKQD